MNVVAVAGSDGWARLSIEVTLKIPTAPELAPQAVADRHHLRALDQIEALLPAALSQLYFLDRGPLGQRDAPVLGHRLDQNDCAV